MRSSQGRHDNDGDRQHSRTDIQLGHPTDGINLGSVHRPGAATERFSSCSTQASARLSRSCLHAFGPGSGPLAPTVGWH
jgi:hypothetical protein